MFYRNPDGYNSLVVKEGQQVTLSARHAQKTGLTVCYVRPRTTAALLTMAGMKVPNAPRLSDPHAFQITDHTDGLVNFSSPDPEGKLGGYSSHFIRGLLQAFDPRQDTPPSQIVRYFPLKPEKKDCGCTGRKWTALDTFQDNLADSNELELISRKTHRIIKAFVPDFIAKFEIYSLFTRFGDIIIEPNGTLILDDDIRFAIAENLLAYRRSTVIQKADYLNLDINGTLRGGMNKFVHHITDIVHVNWKALAAEPLEKP